MSDPTGRAPSVARWESFGRLSSGVSGAEDGGVLSGEPDSDAMVSGGDSEDNVTKEQERFIWGLSIISGMGWWSKERDRCRT